MRHPYYESPRFLQDDDEDVELPRARRTPERIAEILAFQAKRSMRENGYAS